MEEPAAAPSALLHGPAPAAEAIRAAALKLLAQRDLTDTSIRMFKQELATHLGCALVWLEGPAVGQILQNVVTELTQKASSPHALEDDGEVGEENPKASRRVYLVTAPHPRSASSSEGQQLRAPGEFSREEICNLLRAALAATQGPRCSPLNFLSMVVFSEKHQTTETHYHVAVLADRCFRFLPLKRMLLESHGLATHWSCSHDCYATCVAYGYVPSPQKTLADLDPTPFTWALSGEHLPLAQASRPSTTSVAIAKRLEAARLKRAEQGKPEGRFRDVDLWPVVVRENILPDERCADRVMAYAKRCGGQAMVDYAFANWPRLKELVTRSWQAERVEESIVQHAKSRLQMLEEASLKPCKCHGKWPLAAADLFAANGINPNEWRLAVLAALRDGRVKGNLVCHAGKEGNEGKSFLLAPLLSVYGAEGVFQAPPKNAFPLLDLEACRLTLLDDWRFNESILPFNLQLLWFEGKTIVIARPQNQFSGHLRYSKDWGLEVLKEV